MEDRGRADQGIAEGRRVGDVEGVGEPGDLLIHGQDPPRERPGHALVQPATQERAARGIAPFREPDPAWAVGSFSAGQFLSLFMFVIGTAFVAWGMKTRQYEAADLRR